MHNAHTHNIAITCRHNTNTNSTLHNIDIINTNSTNTNTNIAGSCTKYKIWKTWND